ncbi:MAG: hypothetical protein KIT33_09530 [Candidatus Kapabacteria bacterium]|nr:hypothetical protein [Ignavibacteriota bacterium]MCW5885198.1 hypothetical protein [Candidatus Kapabacteria bacterium]
MHEIEEFINIREGNQYYILKKLHSLITVFDIITCKIRFKIPFYDAKNWVCYLNPLKKDSVEVVFTHGNLLTELFPVLDLRGRKKVAGIIYKNADEIDDEMILLILEKAIEYDVIYGNPFLKKKI